MPMSNAERQRRWRERRKQVATDQCEKGKQKLEVWINPTTAKRLDRLTAQYGSAEKVIERAVREMARDSQLSKTGM